VRFLCANCPQGGGARHADRSRQSWNISIPRPAVKDRIGAAMIIAMEEGRATSTPDTVLIEPTSGKYRHCARAFCRGFPAATD